MPDKSETGQTGGQDVKEQARSEIRERIEKAKSKEEKEELGKELAERLEEAIEEAKEVVDNEKKVEKGEKVFIKEKEKNQVTARVIQVFEAVRQEIPVAKTPQAQAFLKKIIEEIPSPSSSQCNQLAAYLTPYLLGEKEIIINPPDQPKSDFQRDFEQLATVNPDLAEKVKEALLKAIKDGKIKSLNEGLLENLEITSLEELRPTSGKMMTEDERREYIELWRRILELHSQRIVSGQATEEYQKKMMNIQMVFLPVRDVSPLRELGFSDDAIKRFLTLRDKFNQSLDTRFLGQYTPILEPVIEQAKIDFSNIENFFSYDKDGRITMTKQQKQAFENLIRKYYYKGLSIIHQNTSQEFNSVLRDRSELHYYFSLIGQVITHSCDRIRERLPDTKDYEELRLFFEDKSESFMSRIMNNAQLFHNLPLYARNLGSVEEIKKLFSYLYPSQLAEVFDDKSNLLSIARNELTMLLREYLATHGNEYDGTLLSGRYREEGVRWSEWFKEEYKKRLKHKLRRLNLYRGEEDEWKLDMLRTYSEGIGIATLIDPEILAASDPVSHFREVHPLMTLLSAKHNWKGGRGKGIPGLINRFLLGMDVDLFPQTRPFLKRLVSRKKFIPQEFYDQVEEKIRDYGGIIADEMTDGQAKASLFGMGGLYQELISMFNLPGSIDSWHGWRVEGVTKELGKVFEILFGKEKGKINSLEDWQNFFDLSLELYGTTSLWWQIGVFGGARPVEEMRLLLGNRYEYLSHHPNDKGIYIDGQKLTFLELRMWRMNQLRAELFFRYLRRNPGDFLQILTQLCPDLLDKEGKIFRDDKELSKEEKAKQRALKKRWGEEGFKLLARVNRWIIEKSQSTLEPETGKPFSDPKEFMIYFRERTSDAFERMRLRNEEARRKIIEIANSKKSNEEKRQEILQIRKNILYLTRQDFSSDEIVWNLFAGGEDSFFNLITGISYDKADGYFSNFGSFSELGKKTIFFEMANNWFLRNGDINPFTADIAYYDIYRHIPYSGESTFSRLWEANIATYKEVISQIPNLENLLLEAAESGKLDKIYELHHKIFEVLSGMAGPEYAYRANYILSQIVAQFFMEHSVLRDPKWKWLAPVGLLARPLLGNNVSLSRLLTHNLHALSMDNNALRTYFMTLAYDMHVLPVEGMFSLEQLEKVFEVTKGEFIIGDVAPSLLWFITLFLLFNYIKKAIEEAGGKKK